MKRPRLRLVKPGETPPAQEADPATAWELTREVAELSARLGQVGLTELRTDLVMRFYAFDASRTAALRALEEMTPPEGS